MRLLTYQEIDILFDRAATLRPVLIDGKPIIFSTLTRGDECINFAHAIIAATVAKLTAGVSVEPVGYADADRHVAFTAKTNEDFIVLGRDRDDEMGCSEIPYFSADQLQTAIAAARVYQWESGSGCLCDPCCTGGMKCE